MNIDKNKLEEILKNLWKKDDGCVSLERISYNKALQEIQYEIDKLEIMENSVSTSSKSNQPSKEMPTWKHWVNGIAGNGECKPIYLTKVGNTYNLTSCLGFECDYIELSELDKLLSEKQGEPKFKVGDWVTTGEYTTPLLITRVDIDNNKYEVSASSCGLKGFPKIDYIDSLYRLWTIKDAKDGDVLVHTKHTSDDFDYIFIYNKTCINQAYCYYSKKEDGFFIINRNHHSPWNKKEDIMPATKKQRDLFWSKLKAAHFEWNAKNKTFKWIGPMW